MKFPVSLDDFMSFSLTSSALSHKKSELRLLVFSVGSDVPWFSLCEVPFDPDRSTDESKSVTLMDHVSPRLFSVRGGGLTRKPLTVGPNLSRLETTGELGGALGTRCSEKSNLRNGRWQSNLLGISSSDGFLYWVPP